MHTWAVLAYQQADDADPAKVFHVRAAAGPDAEALVKRSPRSSGFARVEQKGCLRTDTPGTIGIIYEGPWPWRAATKLAGS